MRDFRDAKAMARTLRAALDAIGVKITVSQSLELIAQSFGVPDWNTLSAVIKGPAAPAPGNSPAPAQSASNPGKPAAPSTPSLSRRLIFALRQVYAYAKERKHEAMRVEHLLLFLLDDVEVSQVMKGCGGNLDEMRRKLTEYIDSHVKSQAAGGGDNPQPTLGFQRSLQRAFRSTPELPAPQARVTIATLTTAELAKVAKMARQHAAELAGSERPIPTTCVDVLVGIFGEAESHAVKLLNEQGVTRTNVVDYISHGGPDDPQFSSPFE